MDKKIEAVYFLCIEYFIEFQYDKKNQSRFKNKSFKIMKNPVKE